MKHWDRFTEALARLFGTAFAWIFRLRVHFFLVVSTRSKCPGCGCRKEHELKWVPAPTSKLAHLCAVCSAEWCEAPVRSAESWEPRPDFATGKVDEQGEPIKPPRFFDNREPRLLSEAKPAKTRAA